MCAAACTPVLGPPRPRMPGLPGASASDGGRAPPRLSVWETPVLVVPLERASNELCGGTEAPVVARIALSFSVTADPEELLLEAEEAEMPLLQRMERAADRVVDWLQVPAMGFACSGNDGACRRRSNSQARPEAPSRGLLVSADSAEPEAETASCRMRTEEPATTDWTFRL